MSTNERTDYLWECHIHIPDAYPLGKVWGILTNNSNILSNMVNFPQKQVIQQNTHKLKNLENIKNTLHTSKTKHCKRRRTLLQFNEST